LGNSADEVKSAERELENSIYSRRDGRLAVALKQISAQTIVNL